jgi:hypothetical protein
MERLVATLNMRRQKVTLHIGILVVTEETEDYEVCKGWQISTPVLDGNQVLGQRGGNVLAQESKMSPSHVIVTRKLMLVFGDKRVQTLKEGNKLCAMALLQGVTLIEL